MRRRLVSKSMVVLALSAVCLNTVFTAPAQAAVPRSALGLGTYPIIDYDGGIRYTSNLSVTDNGGYRQTYYLHGDTVEFTLENGTQVLYPYHLYLRRLYIGGLLFTSNGGNNGAPVMYRPYGTAGVLGPNQTWNSTLHSTSGGVSVNLSSRSSLKTLRSAGVNTPVQLIETTMSFFGNASGTVLVRSFEVPAVPSKTRTDFLGSMTAMGQRFEVQHHVILGGLES